MKTKKSSVLCRRNRTSQRLALTTIALVGVFSSIAQRATAGSATWNLNPTSSDWNTAANWTPETVPSAVDDVATFRVSNITDVAVSEFLEIGDIIFEPRASPYNITAYFGLNHNGVINNSGITQNFDVSFGVGFAGTASAGSYVVYTSNGSANGAFSILRDQSNAGSATFINNGATPAAYAAFLDFEDESSAADSTIINNGPRDGENGGSTSFGGTSTAGNSTIVVNTGGFAQLTENATAGSAVLMIAGGRLDFEGLSLGGLAQVRLSNGGLLVVKGHAKASLILGSLEGEGTVQVASQEFGIGSNGLDTTFAGVIAEATGKPKIAVVRKVGSGTLTLSGVNLYGGGTIVDEGTLLVKTKRDSATGSGPVQVNAGTFGGRSNIAGAVTIGSGSGPGATLAPGIIGPGVLAIYNTLTFQADGSYNWEVNLAKSKGDKVICKGATIAGGAQFTLDSRGNQSLPAGTIFTVIENKTRQPISGTFANLPDGAILNVNGNQLQASYEGGDGNDLTLTVVP